MHYQNAYIAHCLRKSAYDAPTKEEFVQNAVDQRPKPGMTLEQLNEYIRKRTPKDAPTIRPLTEFSEEERKKRHDLSLRVRKAMFKRVADRKYVPSHPTNIRYPEDLMMKPLETEDPKDPEVEAVRERNHEADRYNQHVQEIMILPEGHEKEVIDLHYQLAERLKNMDKEKLFLNPISDEELVNSFDDVIEAYSLGLQAQNVRNYFANNHIEPPDEESRKRLDECLAIFKDFDERFTFPADALGRRLALIENPYYEMIDYMDPEFSRVVSYDKQNDETYDFMEPEQSEPSLTVGNLISDYVGNAASLRDSYWSAEKQYTEQYFKMLGVDPANLVYELNGDGEPRTFLTEMGSVDSFENLASRHEADYFEVYDKTDPEKKLTLFADLNHSIGRLVNAVSQDRKELPKPVMIYGGSNIMDRGIVEKPQKAAKPVKPQEPDGDASEADLAEYESAMAEYNERMADYESYLAELEEYRDYQAELRDAELELKEEERSQQELKFIEAYQKGELKSEKAVEEPEKAPEEPEKAPEEPEKAPEEPEKAAEEIEPDAVIEDSEPEQLMPGEGSGAEAEKAAEPEKAPEEPETAVEDSEPEPLAVNEDSEPEPEPEKIEEPAGPELEMPEAYGGEAQDVSVLSGEKRVRDRAELFSAGFGEPKALMAMDDVPVNMAEKVFDKAIKSLSDNLNLQLGTEEQQRLYFLNNRNQLVSLRDQDFFTENGRKDFYRMLRANRLFAVPAGEAAPVQVTAKEDYTGEIRFADNLAVRPKKPSGWTYFLNRLGISRNVTARYETELAEFNRRAAVQDAIDAVAVDRKAKGFLDGSARVEAAAFGTPADRERTRHAAILADEAKTHAVGDRLAALKKQLKERDANDAYARDAGRKEKGAQSMRDIYGAKPVFHETWTDKYTKEQFDTLTSYDLKLEQNAEGPRAKDENGRLKLTEDDFVALGFAAVGTPEVGGKCTYVEEHSKDADPAMLIDARATMFTADLAGTEDTPRASIGGFFADGIQPARQEAKEAVEAYRAGDDSRLAYLIASGISYYDRQYSYMQQTSSGQKGVTHFFNRLVSMAEEDPVLLGHVREAGERIKQECAAGLENCKKENAELWAQHPEMKRIRTLHDDLGEVREKILSLNDMVKEKKAKNLPYNQGAVNLLLNDRQNMRDRMEKDMADELKAHPDYPDLLLRDAEQCGKQIYYQKRMSFDLDKAMQRSNGVKKAAEIVQKGAQARAVLADAQYTKRTLAPEEKQNCLRDILRADLVTLHNTLHKDTTDDGTERVKAENPTLRVLAVSPFKQGSVSANSAEKLVTDKLCAGGNNMMIQIQNMNFTTDPLSVNLTGPDSMEKLDKMVNQVVSSEQQKEMLKLEPTDLLKKVSSPSYIAREGIAKLNVAENVPAPKAQVKAGPEVPAVSQPALR